MNFFAETFADMAKMGLDTGMLPGLCENKAAFVAKADVAAAVAGALLADDQAGLTYNLSGPTAISGDNRAALVAQATGRPLRYAILPEDALRGGLVQSGTPDFLVDTLVAMQKAFSQGAYDIVTGDVEHLAGRPPRSLSDALASVFGQEGRS